MKLIVGLGNPGREYAATRHNIGFMVVDRLAHKLGCAVEKKKFKALYGQGQIRSEKVLLAKPQTYMNLSGEAVGAFGRYARIPPDHILVVHDDLDLEWGRIRMVTRGGAAGHKGILSVMAHLNTQVFLRLRVGIGRPPDSQATEDYVLEPIPPAGRSELTEVVDLGRAAIEHLLLAGIEKTMSVYNSRKKI